MGDVRRKLWHERIRIEEVTGHGLSKAVSKLYASWLRTARMKQHATLRTCSADPEEQGDMTPEWLQYLPEIYESIRGGQDPAAVPQKFLHLSEEESKMKRIRKAIRDEKDEWMMLMKQMKEHKCGGGFDWLRHERNTLGTPQMKNQWEDARTELRRRTDEAQFLDVIREGMKLIPEYIAQWDWYVRRMEESKAPVMEQWKTLYPLRMKLGIPWNFRPNLPKEAYPNDYDEVAVEIWSWDEATKKNFSQYGPIWADDWEEDKTFADFAKGWKQAGQKWRSDSFGCFSPPAWTGASRFGSLKLNREQIRERRAVWVGNMNDQPRAMLTLMKAWRSHQQEKQKAQEGLKMQTKSLTEKQLTFRQYEFMTEVLTEEIRRLICAMNLRKEELEETQELAEDEEDLMKGLGNILKVMATNATEMIRSLDQSGNRAEI